MIAAAATAPGQPAFTALAPCLLVNPRSFRVSHHALAERAARLARARGIEVITAAGAAEIAAAVDLLLDRRQAKLIVLAGDGTVQAVADRLAMLPAGVPQPQLLVLGGGRSNLTAADLGGCGAVLAKLERAAGHWHDDTALGFESRYVLKIEQPPAPPRHGFFLAAGLLDYAIRACHRDRDTGSGMLHQGHAATAWSVLKMALPAMLGAHPPRLDDLHIELPDGEAMAKPARLLMATTLQGGQRLLDPFAKRGQGAVRFTALAARGFGLWARLPRIVTGRFTRAMDAKHGYASGRCEGLLVQGLSSYTLDGEEFEADPTRPVTIRQGPPLSFRTP